MAIDFSLGSIVPSGNSRAELKLTKISRKNKTSTVYSKYKRKPVEESSIKQIR
jgi:hypothetical protein